MLIKGLNYTFEQLQRIDFFTWHMIPEPVLVFWLRTHLVVGSGMFLSGLHSVYSCSYGTRASCSVQFCHVTGLQCSFPAQTWHKNVNKLTADNRKCAQRKPYFFTTRVDFPFCHAILSRDVLAFWHQFHVYFCPAKDMSVLENERY